jgi:hypothetical protein
MSSVLKRAARPARVAAHSPLGATPAGFPKLQLVTGVRVREAVAAQDSLRPAIPGGAYLDS